MAVNLLAQPVCGYGSEPRVVSCSFAPNGESNPLVASNAGPQGIKSFATVYAATGQYTITFPVDFAPPAGSQFLLSAQCASLATYYEVIQVGAYNAATRVLVVQAKQAASGVAVAAAAGARIHIGIIFNESTGA